MSSVRYSSILRAVRIHTLYTPISRYLHPINLGKFTAQVEMYMYILIRLNHQTNLEQKNDVIG